MDDTFVGSWLVRGVYLRGHTPLPAPVLADTGLRKVTSTPVQFRLWPAQLTRAFVLAAALFLIRSPLANMGVRGSLAIAGIMVGIDCLGGFTGPIDT